MVAASDEAVTLASKINVTRYSSFDKLLKVTARVFATYREKL